MGVECRDLVNFGHANAEFFRERFTADLQPVAGLSDGVCLATKDGRQFLFYQEDTSEIRVDLADAAGELPAIAVDTKRAYMEIDLGRFDAEEVVWTAPYNSDWAIAVGESGE